MHDSAIYSRDEQTHDTSARRPHLVILGAGASVAACPNGDANGRGLPLMLNLVETLDLADLFDSAGVSYRDENFELVYAKVAASPNLRALRHQIEERVAEYFRGIHLPDTATIYDYLVLSLRPKDAIATFNWDPLLWQALQRNYQHAPPPKFFFLHGCAVIGWCETDKEQGWIGQRCRRCGKQYVATRLLYPVDNKDYTSDAYIASQWRSVRAALGGAFLLTLFGYGAPDTDAMAIDLMSTAWGTPDQRSMEEIEIIDVKPERQLAKTWSRFIHSHHYSVSDDYFASILGNYPRRSVEAYWQSLIEARVREENPVPRTTSLQELRAWFKPLLESEVGTA